MTTSGGDGRLARRVAERAVQVFEEDGASSPGLSGLLDALELFVPHVLRAEFPEWGAESLDGFVGVARASNGQDSFELVGAAIMIRDQRLTPFSFTFHFARPAVLRTLDIRLGEEGGGDLAIAGAPWRQGIRGPGQERSSADRAWVYRAEWVFSNS